MTLFFATIGTCVLGRKTYDGTGKMGGEHFPPSSKVFVFSRTLPQAKAPATSSRKNPSPVS